MKRLVTLSLAAAMVCGLAAASLAEEKKPAAPAKKAAVKSEPVMVAAGDLKWVDVPDMKGAQQAVVTGDPTKGAYDAFDKWPAGFESPPHTHTLAIEAIVVSGVMVISLDGGTAKEYPAGSYAKIPGGMKHTSGCKAGADCIFFAQQHGKFDMKPVTAPPAK
jgi:anti-sigma factor ChrR (cupin superfamily)